MPKAEKLRFVERDALVALVMAMLHPQVNYSSSLFLNKNAVILNDFRSKSCFLSS